MNFMSCANQDLVFRVICAIHVENRTPLKLVGYLLIIQHAAILGIGM